MLYGVNAVRVRAPQRAAAFDFRANGLICSQIRGIMKDILVFRVGTLFRWAAYVLSANERLPFPNKKAEPPQNRAFCAADPLCGVLCVCSVGELAIGKSTRGRILCGACEEQLVDLRAAEQDDHTEIEPQHDEAKSRKTAIDEGCAAEMCDVQGVAERIEKPSQRGADRSRHMTEKFAADHTAFAGDGVVEDREHEGQEREKERRFVGEDPVDEGKRYAKLGLQEIRQ